MFDELAGSSMNLTEPNMAEILAGQLGKSVDVLDITAWQKSKLREIGLQTIGDVLRASEGKIQEAHYVGQKRSRQMRNAADAAVSEYLSG